MLHQSQKKKFKKKNKEKVRCRCNGCVQKLEAAVRLTVTMNGVRRRTERVSSLSAVWSVMKMKVVVALCALLSLTQQVRETHHQSKRELSEVKLLKNNSYFHTLPIYLSDSFNWKVCPVWHPLHREGIPSWKTQNSGRQCHSLQQKHHSTEGEQTPSDSLHLYVCFHAA